MNDESDSDSDIAVFNFFFLVPDSLVSVAPLPNGSTVSSVTLGWKHPARAKWDTDTAVSQLLRYYGLPIILFLSQSSFLPQC
jgi:hypothetical protein